MPSYVYECKVAVKQGSYNAVPRVMTHEARNAMEAKSYFQSFGQLLNEPRVIKTNR